MLPFTPNAVASRRDPPTSASPSVTSAGVSPPPGLASLGTGSRASRSVSVLSTLPKRLGGRCPQDAAPLRRTHAAVPTRRSAARAGSRSRVRVRATPRRRLAQPGARIPRGMWRPAHASRPAAVPVRLCVRGPSSQSPYLAQTTTRTRCVLLAPTSVAQLFPAETVKRFSDVACAALRNPIRKNAPVKRSCDLTRI